MFFPRCSMYGIFPDLYHRFRPNVGKYSIQGAYKFCCRVKTRSTKRVKGPALQRITTKAPALPVIACFWEAGLSHKKSWKIRQESHSGKISMESIGNGPVNQDFVYHTICFSEGFSIFQPAIHGNLYFLHF